jgi:hypothetical protein
VARPPALRSRGASGLGWHESNGAVQRCQAARAQPHATLRLVHLQTEFHGLLSRSIIPLGLPEPELQPLRSTRLHARHRSGRTHAYDAKVSRHRHKGLRGWSARSRRRVRTGCLAAPARPGARPVSSNMTSAHLAPDSHREDLLDHRFPVRAREHAPSRLRAQLYRSQSLTPTAPSWHGRPWPASGVMSRAANVMAPVFLVSCTPVPPEPTREMSGSQSLTPRSSRYGSDGGWGTAPMAVQLFEAPLTAAAPPVPKVPDALPGFWASTKDSI